MNLINQEFIGYNIFEHRERIERLITIRENILINIKNYD